MTLPARSTGFVVGWLQNSPVHIIHKMLFIFCEWAAVNLTRGTFIKAEVMFSFIRQLPCTCRWLHALGLFHTGPHSGSSLDTQCRCSDMAGRPRCCSPDHTDTRPHWSKCLPRSVRTHCRPGTYRGLLGQLKADEEE